MSEHNDEWEKEFDKWALNSPGPDESPYIFASNAFESAWKLRQKEIDTLKQQIIDMEAKLNIAKEALVNIIKHQEFYIKGVNLSTTCKIAKQALEKLEVE